MSSKIDLSSIANEARQWRQHLHQYPELLFDLPTTAAFVAKKLKEFGCDEIITGIAETGIVAVIKGSKGNGKTVGLRCDMDALPIDEKTDLPYASKIAHRMHACGHDGHTAMLLGAAKYLAATRDFSGKVVLIFQPAEEGGGGGRVMIQEGMFERFGIDEVYGMHNAPGVGIGSFAIRSGAIMAAADRFLVTLNGVGGHAATPHLTRDSILANAHLIIALQSVASRFIDPFDPVVVSVCCMSAGSSNALNVIPASAQIGGTFRTMKAETRVAIEARFREIVESTAQLFGVKAEITWRPGYPVTVNDAEKTKKAAASAVQVAGVNNVDIDYAPSMGAEDFSYMLMKCPGAIIFIGNGDSAALHHPAYDFNDEAILHGIKYWLALAGSAV